MLEDFIRLAGTLPLDQLRSVDNPLLVKDNPGDRSFAFWARDHLPQLADVVEALKAHYERQREDAMHLISVMDK